MLASSNTFPATLPPGFSYIEGEPAFDPKRHLALETPKTTWSLEDFGYDPAARGQFASQVAATSPVRLLSDEGIATTQAVLELLRPRIVTHNKGDPDDGRQRIYFGAYHSRFMRDLAACPEVTAFLSEIFKTPIAAHTMGHLGCQINFGTVKPGSQVSGWHHDIVGFTVVLSLHDPSALDGGHFVYYKGPRDEGQRLLDAGRPLPREKLVVADSVPIGHATIMQGTAILHGAQPLRRAGFRCNIVNSYVSRDVTAPDPNRGFLLRDGYPGSPFNPIYCEMARHAAWLGQAKLGAVLESLPWTEDPAQVVRTLKAAVADVERCIQQIDVGEVGPEEYAQDYGRADHWQMTAPAFQLGAGRSSRD